MRVLILIRRADPLHIIHRGKARADEDAPPPGVSEKEAREHSIRVNKRRRFVNCIGQDDVDIGASSVCYT